MRAYSLLLFYICFNLAIGIFVVTEIIPVGAWMQHSEADISAQFNLTVFTAAAGGATLGGIVAIITKQYLFATGIILIWVIGVLYTPVNWLLIGFPLMLAALLPAELSAVASAFSILSTIVFFVFFAEILGGRQVT